MSFRYNAYSKVRACASPCQAALWDGIESAAVAAAQCSSHVADLFRNKGFASRPAMDLLFIHPTVRPASQAVPLRPLALLSSSWPSHLIGRKPANLIMLRKPSFERHKWSHLQTRAYVLRYAVALGNFIATELCDMFVIRSASWPFSNL